VAVRGVAEQHAAAIADHVLDDRAGDAEVATEGLLAVLLALHLELAGALVLDEHADVLGLREQIEQRIHQLLEECLGGIARGGGVEDLGERVELALDQAHRALVRDVDQAARDDRVAPRLRAQIVAALDQRGRADVDDRHRMPLGHLRRVRLALARLDANPVVRDQDLVVVAQRGRGLEAHAVDERAVVRAEILEHPAFAGLPQPRMLARDAHVGHEDLAIRAPADHVFAVL
jgi:hypothetical protein